MILCGPQVENFARSWFISARRFKYLQKNIFSQKFGLNLWKSMRKTSQVFSKLYEEFLVKLFWTNILKNVFENMFGNESVTFVQVKILKQKSKRDKKKSKISFILHIKVLCSFYSYQSVFLLLSPFAFSPLNLNKVCPKHEHAAFQHTEMCRAKHCSICSGV